MLHQRFLVQNDNERKSNHDWANETQTVEVTPL